MAATVGIGGCSPLATPDYIHEGKSAPAASATAARQDQPPRLDAAIGRAVAYLCASVDATGRFAYVRHPTKSSRPKRYNMLRHAGTLYAMATASQNDQDGCLRKAAQRGGHFLRSHLVAIPAWPQTLAVFRDPKKRSKGKLGGAGLALVAAASWQQRGLELIPLSDLQKLARFILQMQKNNGSFYSRWLGSNERPDASWTSLYYPGEAALGLLMLYRLDRDAAWLQGATKALLYLARRRRGKTRVPADHWALLATRERLALRGDAFKESERALLQGHAKQIVATILAEARSSAAPARAPHHGSFDSSGRTTPAATRLEGLQAAQQILPAKHPLQPAIERAVKHGMAFLLRMQIAKGDLRGGMPRSLLRDQKTQTINGRAREVRIDYVQHALSAWLQRKARLDARSLGRSTN